MSGPSRQYLLGLGSNLGDRAEHLARAVRALDATAECRVLAISPAVDSDPVGLVEQPCFLNLCVAIASPLDPDALLRRTLAIERRLGRVRTAERNGPRTLDIDLLFHEGGAWSSPTVTLPHPRWSSRSFVVIPLGNLLQDPALAKHPGWASLAAEIRALPISGDGLRAWQGPTPWSATP